MRDGVSWLYGELPRLVDDGVLTPEAAEALRQHYGPPAPATARVPWGQILLASFGALLVGGGVILIVAHNWDGLGRPVRAAIALSLLLAAQALTLFAVLRRTDSVAWTEASSGLLVGAVGAAIALVGQTYHLGGSFESLLLVWLWLIVAVPYLTGSSLAAIVFWSLLVVRITALPYRAMPWDPWLLAFAAIPFVVTRVRKAPESWPTALLATSAAGSVLIVGSHTTLQAGWSGMWAVFQVSFLAAIVAAAAWPPEAHENMAGSWRGRIFVPAWIGLIALGTALSFDDTWRRASITARHLQNLNIIGAALIAVASATFASVVTIRLALVRRHALAACTAAGFLVVLAHGLALVGIDVVGWFLFNAWLVAVGCLTLADGIRDLKLGAANRGLLTLSTLLVVRFFDTDLDFLVRGLLFVTLGIACFALNFWLMRRVRRGS